MKAGDPDSMARRMSSREKDRTFVLFLARLMLRPCEPRAFQWEDIDSKRHLVHIRRHYSLNEIRPATKSKNVKILPLSIELEDHLSLIESDSAHADQLRDRRRKAGGSASPHRVDVFLGLIAHDCHLP